MSNEPMEYTDEESTRRLNAIDLIVKERMFQDAKWGKNRDHHDLFWMGILMEEVGEAATAIIEEKPIPDLRKELIQVGAVAMCWLEMLEKYESEREDQK